MSLDFLAVEDVLAIHRLELERYGGPADVRDRGLLESAVALPSATFEAEYLHDGLPAMAAAYLYHLVRNHPFFDGNQRTGLLAALVFLDLNGAPIADRSDELFELTTAVAEGQLGKEELTQAFRRLAGGPE